MENENFIQQSRAPNDHRVMSAGPLLRISDARNKKKGDLLRGAGFRLGVFVGAFLGGR